MVGEYCRSLKSLMVKECRNVTEQSLQRLRDRMFVDVQPTDIRFIRRVFPDSIVHDHRINLQI